MEGYRPLGGARPWPRPGPVHGLACCRLFFHYFFAGYSFACYWLLCTGYGIWLLANILFIIYYLLPLSIYYIDVYQLWVTGPQLAGVTCSFKEIYKSKKITKIADRGKQKWLPRHVGAGLPQPYSQAKSWFLIERYAEIVVIIRSARLVGGRVGGRGSFFCLCRLRAVLLGRLEPWKQRGNSRWKPCGSVFRGY